MSARGIETLLVAMILSPLLTIIGIVVASRSKPPNSTICWCGTVISALPGLYLFIAIRYGQEIYRLIH